jgi:hypothetical protein
MSKPTPPDLLDDHVVHFIDESLGAEDDAVYVHLARTLNEPFCFTSAFYEFSVHCYFFLQSIVSLPLHAFV